MGFIWFPSPAVTLPSTIITILRLLDVILNAVSVMLYRVGLNPSFVPTPSDNEEFLFSAGPTPSELSETAALVKRRLRTAPYKRIKGGAPAECVVCLECLEDVDNVRVLGNCDHVFHVDCIDRWVDFGQFSCPLCRAGLLPEPAAGGGMVALFLKVVLAGMRRRCFH